MATHDGRRTHEDVRKVLESFGTQLIEHADEYAAAASALPLLGMTVTLEYGGDSGFVPHVSVEYSQDDLGSFEKRDGLYTLR